jgi:hypothetical protein
MSQSSTLYGVWDAEHNAWADARGNIVHLTDQPAPEALHRDRAGADHALRGAVARFGQTGIAYLRGHVAVDRRVTGRVAAGALRIDPPRLVVRGLALTPEEITE